MAMLRISIVVVLMLTFAISSTSSPSGLPDSLIKTIQAAVDCHRVPGLALSVVFQGREVVSTGFGLANVNKNLSVTGSTKFFIGSVTKTFMATLLGILLAENNYTALWDTLVIDIMGPEFNMTDRRGEWMTVRDVLSHRMGLVSYTLALMFGQDGGHPDREFCSRFRYINATKFNSFRNQFEYSNLMYVLVGCMVEVVGHRDVETALRERLLKPLGMNDTSLATDVHYERLDDVAQMYYINETDQKMYPLHMDTLRCLTSLRPAGGLLTTASDMAKFMQFLANGGRTSSGQQLIPAALFNRMFAGQIPYQRGDINEDVFPILDSVESYGLGFLLGYYRGRPTRSHTGRIGGFDTRMTILPGTKLGIFTSCNGPAHRNFRIHQVIEYLITDHLLNLTQWLDNSTICTFPQPWSPAASNLEDEAGSPSVPVDPKTKELVEIWIDAEFEAGMKDGRGNDLGGLLKGFLDSHSDKYTGQYGHLLLGNYTVGYEESDTTLRYSYGLLGRGRLVFVDGITWFMEIEGPMSYTRVIPYALMNVSLPITFADPENGSGRFRKVKVVSFEGAVPPVFERGLRWSGESKAALPVHGETVEGLVVLLASSLVAFVIATQGFV